MNKERRKQNEELTNEQYIDILNKFTLKEEASGLYARAGVKQSD